jgi:hypothetical protein
VPNFIDKRVNNKQITVTQIKDNQFLVEGEYDTMKMVGENEYCIMYIDIDLVENNNIIYNCIYTEPNFNLDYVNKSVYNKGKLRKFNYTTVPNDSTKATQEAAIKLLYSTTGDVSSPTWNNKVKFDS